MAENSKRRAADVAAALVKSTAENTAMALNIQYIQRDITEIKQGQKENAGKLEQALKDIGAKDDQFVLKNEFNFWRNVLISGIILTIFLGILGNFLKN